jgi:hypothetical protein
MGWKKHFKRHARLADATRSAAKALGLELYAPESPSNAVTAIKAPAGIDAQKIVKILRDKHNITIAGGQGEAKGKIFRIAHMGYLDTYDVIMVISALEMTLKELGVSVEFGKGVKAAAEILEKDIVRTRESMVKVLVSDDLSEQGWRFSDNPGVEVDVKIGLKPDELKAIIGDYDGLAVRSATKATKKSSRRPIG